MIHWVAPAALGYLAGLGTYWAWVIADWHLHKTRKFYE